MGRETPGESGRRFMYPGQEVRILRSQGCRLIIPVAKTSMHFERWRTPGKPTPR